MGLNKFPITLQDCCDLLMYALSLDKDNFNKEISDDYIRTLDTWNRFLGTMTFMIDTINKSTKRGIDIKELIDNGYIK